MVEKKDCCWLYIDVLFLMLLLQAVVAACFLLFAEDVQSLAAKIITDAITKRKNSFMMIYLFF